MVIADLIFVYHSMLMVAIQVVQCFIYEVRFFSIKRGKNTISKETIIILAFLWATVAVEAILYAVMIFLVRLVRLDGMSIGTRSLFWDTQNL